MQQWKRAIEAAVARVGGDEPEQAEQAEPQHDDNDPRALAQALSRRF